MKRFLPLLIIALVFSSCQDDVKFNNPGFQGQKDGAFWRSNFTQAYMEPSGKLRIEAQTEYETITLNTGGPNEGTYILGTTDVNNSATYTSNFQDQNLQYATSPVPGPVSSIYIFMAGTGYSSGSLATTGGSGTGLIMNIVADASGVVTQATPSSRGNGYKAGDVITVTGGNGNCKLIVQNVQNSNGQIIITDYDNLNQTITGEFTFNAANINNSPFGGPILNFQYGKFYKIPILPST